jgi:hypothetical protein
MIMVGDILFGDEATYGWVIWFLFINATVSMVFWFISIWGEPQ